MPFGTFHDYTKGNSRKGGGGEELLVMERHEGEGREGKNRFR